MERIHNFIQIRMSFLLRSRDSTFPPAGEDGEVDGEVSDDDDDDDDDSGLFIV